MKNLGPTGPAAALAENDLVSGARDSCEITADISIPSCTDDVETPWGGRAYGTNPSNPALEGEPIGDVPLVRCHLGQGGDRPDALTMTQPMEAEGTP